MAAESGKNGRIKFSRRALLAAFGALVGRLWMLQGRSSASYLDAADRQRFRVLSVPADRGVMYDREGRILVRNVPSFNVVISRPDLPEDEVARRQVLERIGALLDIRVSGPAEDGRETIESILEAAKDLPLLEPVVLRRGVDEETAFVIEQQQLTLPGISVQVEARREYPYGELLGHVLGYVGPVPAEAVEEYRRWGYSPNDTVGQTGLEHSYESVLRGRKGEQRLEVNVEGRKVRVVGQPVEPEPGANLVLTIDVELQRAAAEALRKGMARKESPAGVVVALDPRDGAIRALVSLPGYDNNLFSGGISHEDLVRLSEDPRFPLVNRSISGVYPPGSTFKMVTASAGLQEGVIDRETKRTCGGVMYVTSDDGSQRYPFYCFNRGGHGSLNVIGAIRHSCDIFFYQVAGGYEDFAGLGQKRLASYARHFGLGNLTGVDLPGELPGLIPDPKWKRLTRQQLWVTGDTYNAGIGQGDILTTPLQMACVTMAVANGGTVYQPRLGDYLMDGRGKEIARYLPRVVGRVPVSAGNLEIVRQGMREAVAIGTARSLGIKEIEVAGKTGTAEFFGPRTPDGHLPMHAWFVSFAPFEEPEIVVVALIEDSGEGAYYAVPVVAEVLRAYFGLSPSATAAS
ncbi:MAG: penicillin-binding protein 2 [Anaerolineae bacterium]|nr:penicillin-binding protein 2 [Anaerolineae bacterium]